MSELELINHTKLNLAGSDLSRKHVGPMSDDTPRRSPSAFKGVASGRTGVLGGSRRPTKPVGPKSVPLVRDRGHPLTGERAPRP